MHSHSIDQWTHDHVFLGAQHDRNERRTWFVVTLTAAMMVGEIVAAYDEFDARASTGSSDGSVAPARDARR